MLNKDPLEERELLDELEYLSQHDKCYGSGKIFNSICSTPHPISKKIFNKYIEHNMGDNRIYPSLNIIEEKTIAMIGDILGDSTVNGIMLSGGTEANILALFLAKEKFQKKTPNLTPVVLAFDNVHFSIIKACKILGVKLEYLPLDEEEKANYELLDQRITKDTMAVVATAGTSELGMVDDIERISSITKEHNIFLHVDAASGGFIIPFARKLGHEIPKLDLSIEGINTITVDPHKYGMAPIPSGALLIRDSNDYEQLGFSSFFVGTHDHKSILGTRSGASIMATYAVMRSLGYQGYLGLTEKYFHLRDLLETLLSAENITFVHKPEMNIVSLDHPKMDVFINEMEAKGCILSRSINYGCLRLVIVDHHTEEAIKWFVENYINSLLVNANN